MRSHNLRGNIQVAVLGGNGFIGRAIIHRLSSYKNLRIFSIDKNPYNIRLDTAKSAAIIEQINMDINSDYTIQSWFIAHPVDIVIYCIGYEGITEGLNSSFLEDIDSIRGLYTTINSLPHMNLNKEETTPYFMYISSYSVYGHSDTSPKEYSKGYPTNSTGLLKSMGEDIATRLCNKYDIPLCILRPVEVYGKFHPKELRHNIPWRGFLPYFVDKVVKRQRNIVVSSPNTKIDLVNINYVTKFILMCLEQQLEGIFNIGSGKSITLKQLVNDIVIKYAKDMDFLSTVEFNEDILLPNLELDITKSNSILPYDHKKYNLSTFISDYIKARRYEVAKEIAAEDIFIEPVIIDAAAIKAKEAFLIRQARRKLAYDKIAEIAGPDFFKITYGNFQRRAAELSLLELTPDLIEKAKVEHELYTSMYEGLTGQKTQQYVKEYIEEVITKHQLPTNKAKKRISNSSRKKKQ